MYPTLGLSSVDRASRSRTVSMRGAAARETGALVGVTTGA